MLRGAMPLRARLAQYSTAAKVTETDEVLFKTLGAVREITLNRPRKLNAITPAIVQAMTPRLLEYARSDLTGVVVLKGAGEKALSAGGDVAALALNAKEKGLEEGGRENAVFFTEEFALNHLIATYQKPYVALLNGITMGGGVGLSMHASFRVATEKTVVAMPETSIGYYPDVGGLWFLSKLGGEFGLYMALTSARISGYDAYKLGLATHYVGSDRLPELEGRLSELLPDSSDKSGTNFFSLVNTAIEDYATEPALDYQPAAPLLPENRDIIESCFKHDDAEKIVAALRAAGTAFAVEAADILEQRSPTSIKVALAAYRQFSTLDIRTAFKEEMVVCSNFCRSHDFMEGCLALLVEKRKADWQPAKLSEVTHAQVRGYFEPATSEPELVKFTNDRTFEEYPHRYSLPTERDLNLFVIGETAPGEGKVTRDDVLRYFRNRLGDKMGLERHIDEILARKTHNDDVYLNWNY